MKLPYSAEQIEEIKKSYIRRQGAQDKELPENLFCLFIDGYHTSIKDEEVGRVRKAVVYVCIGIDLEGRKTFLGYYVYWGSESRETGLRY